MSAIDLLNDSQKKWVSDENLSPSEPIDYRYSNNTVESTRANVGLADRDKKNKSYIESERLFADVILTNKPAKGDLIGYNGELWMVQEWSASNGVYLLKTIASKKHTMGKTNRPTI